MTAASAPLTNDLIICSFHTDDAYYTAAGDRLRASLEALDLPHEIASISANGADWIDICRQKIPFLHGICTRHPDKKVFWIDGDCTLDHLPDFIRNSAADIIGFQRGFSSPLKIGYAKRTRFWEPCFWGIGTSPAARAYIESARQAEAQITARATDDYFFEEAWRVHAENLSFQVIPSGMVAGKSDTLKPFFVFGASGNVDTFKGQAEQHHSLEPATRTLIPRPKQPAGAPLTFATRVRRKLRREADKLVQTIANRQQPTAQRTKTPTGRSLVAPLSAQKAIEVAVGAAKGGKLTSAEATLAEIQTRHLLNAAQQNAADAAQSFLDYTARPIGDPLRLVWWEKPYPGNFGDWLSPLVFHRMTDDRKVMFVPPNGKASKIHLLGLGSIVKFANSRSIVVGAGASQRDATLDPTATYISLRGPITAEILRAAGGPTIDNFGDPGILMPRVMPIARGSTNGRIALVRHYAHRKLFLKLPDTIDEHPIVMSGAKTIEDFITTLVGYDAVITSAMHIYIICQSYGVPCALVTFATGEDMVRGDGMKYIDYASGVGVPEAAPTVIDLDLRGRDFDNLITDHMVPAAKMDEVAASVTAAIAHYDSQVG
ncbi:MAG: polysaccharide pyruvyl transferase family protein [Pseudomonadota bacterium]